MRTDGIQGDERIFNLSHNVHHHDSEVDVGRSRGAGDGTAMIPNGAASASGSQSGEQGGPGGGDGGVRVRQRGERYSGEMTGGGRCEGA